MTSDSLGSALVGGRDESPESDDVHLLPDPVVLGARRARTHRWVLLLIMVLWLFKGGYWAVATQVWNPIDEAQHFGYVESLARGDGVPTVGKDLLSSELMASVKAGPTTHYVAEPYLPTNEDPNWSSTRHQYEAIHGPTYYALMTPFYWVGRPFGIQGSLYAVRLGTVLLAALVVPLAWALARRLFPRRPAVWLLAPAILMAINGLAFGSVTNDALLLTLGTGALLVAVEALCRPFSTRWVLAAGLLVGLVLVTKSTSLVLLPQIALAFGAWLVVVRPPWRDAARWVWWFAVGGAVTFGPWLLWNLWAYHSLSASAVVSNLTGGGLGEAPLSLSGVRTHLEGARQGLWASQLMTDGPYREVWEWALVVTSAIAIVASIVGRRWAELRSSVWCALSLPLAFVSMEVIVFVLFGGTGGPVGRHLYAGMAPAAIVMAAAVVMVVGSRWAPTVVVGFLTLVLAMEAQLAGDFLRRTYLPTSLGGTMGPVVSQGWADTSVDTSGITVDPPCPATAFTVRWFTGSGPAELTVESSTGTEVAGLVAYPGSLLVYTLDEPIADPFVIDVPPGNQVNASIADRNGEVGFVDRPGDPVVRVFCEVDDPDEVAFQETYPTQHPDVMSLWLLRAIPWMFTALAALATGGLAVLAARPRGRRVTESITR